METDDLWRVNVYMGINAEGDRFLYITAPSDIVASVQHFYLPGEDEGLPQADPDGIYPDHKNWLFDGPIKKLKLVVADE